MKVTEQIYYVYILLKFGKEVHLVKERNGYYQFSN